MHLANEKNRLSSGNIRFALILTALAVGLAGCKGEAAVTQEEVRPVKIAILERASPERALTYSGVVRPRIESPVGFRITGKIVERRVNVGDHVKAGQVIARLDEADLQLAKRSAEAQRDAARTRRDVARAELDRGAQLLQKGFIAKAAFDVRKNEIDAATSALDTAEAQLRQAANAVGYATLRSDAAGTVTSVTAERGQVVSDGDPVITLAMDRETEIAIAVPEQEAGQLSAGHSAKVELWAAPGDSIEGRIREIAGQADPASRTYAVRIAVPRPPRTMRLGMTASVTIKVEDGADAIVVPLAAVTEADGGPVVFVVDRASKVVRKTEVTLGRPTESGVGITRGLRAGDMVVSAGVQFLRDGMRVKFTGEYRLARAPGAS
jgi:multidrug efflux system membrane fusion protein